MQKKKIHLSLTKKKPRLGIEELLRKSDMTAAHVCIYRK